MTEDTYITKAEFTTLTQEVTELKALIIRLSTIVEGQPPFPGVNPVVDDLKAIRIDVDKITDTLTQAKWAAGALGVSNAGSIVALISRFFVG